MELLERRCPKCSGPVDYMLTCHTYKQGGRWMSCMPCDSATYWFCCPDNDEWGCGWSYTDGLNPDNPRAADNERRRPSWLEKT